MDNEEIIYFPFTSDNPLVYVHVMEPFNPYTVELIKLPSVEYNEAVGVLIETLTRTLLRLTVLEGINDIL